ncbi:MAG: peptidase dipeptidase [Candidatus Peribacteria bacterium]|nr:peptidase dipeptidase [Candidatus Peribacteria bacterium]
MKFLLTSGGITNQTIAKALEELLAKPKAESVVAFIPTAANVEEGDKNWLITDLYNVNKLGYKYVDIVDISAVSEDIWKRRLENADVLFFGGGNTFHLMYWLQRSGLANVLPDLLKTRIYAGISAGSMVTGNSISLSQSEKLYYEDLGKYTNETGLGFVEFSFRPHLNSPHFPNVNTTVLQQHAKELLGPIYALDDQMALKIIDGKIEAIGEGEYLVFNIN